MKSNTSKYRYDRVTMGILMSDFAFSKGGTEPGDLFPNFELAATDGEVIAREHFNRSELEHVIAEAWIGVTKEFSRGFSGSFFIRGRTEEIKGPNKRGVGRHYPQPGVLTSCAGIQR